jgi:hypothetical protein
MANKFTYQVLRDSNTDAVIKLTGQFDGTSGNEANTVKIQANTLAFALATNGYHVANTQGGAANTPLSFYNLQITSMQYFVSMGTANPPGSVEVFWAGNGTANNATIFYLNGNGEFGSAQQPAILNNSIGGRGDIGVNTYGVTANTAYTLIISLRKDNAHYSRGQFSDPAAFNYRPYNLNP